MCLGEARICLLRDACGGIATQNLISSETSRAQAKKVEERIVKKSLDIIVFKAVKEEPLSGYDIVLLIRRKFGVKLSAGTVYSLLHSLEKKGLIEANSLLPRCYMLTEEGEETLNVITTMQSSIRTLNSNIF